MNNAAEWSGEEWVADYGQLDFSVSYDLNENINLNVSATYFTL